MCLVGNCRGGVVTWGAYLANVTCEHFDKQAVTQISACMRPAAVCRGVGCNQRLSMTAICGATRKASSKLVGCTLAVFTKSMGHWGRLGCCTSTWKAGDGHHPGPAQWHEPSRHVVVEWLQAPPTSQAFVSGCSAQSRPV